MEKQQTPINGYLAMFVGVLLAAAETRLNWDAWDEWQGWLWWGYFFIGYLPAALLFFGGYRTVRKLKGGLRLLACGWGFTAATTWLGLARAAEDPVVASHYAAELPPLAIFILVGLLLAASLFGMWKTVAYQE